MASQHPPIPTECRRNNISAYIDGELSHDEELKLEFHISECIRCRRDLNEQKAMLRALGSSLESEKEIELPKNFTKVIVTNAEAQVKGLRCWRERLNAIFICAALFLFALFALGSEAETVFGSFGSVLEKIAAVGAFAAHVVYDPVYGTIVVLKSLSSRFLFGSPSSLFVLLVLFAVSFIVFSRLIARIRRTQEN